MSGTRIYRSWGGSSSLDRLTRVQTHRSVMCLLLVGHREEMAAVGVACAGALEITLDHLDSGTVAATFSAARKSVRSGLGSESTCGLRETPSSHQLQKCSQLLLNRL